MVDSWGSASLRPRLKSSRAFGAQERTAQTDPVKGLNRGGSSTINLKRTSAMFLMTDDRFYWGTPGASLRYTPSHGRSVPLTLVNTYLNLAGALRR